MIFAVHFCGRIVAVTVGYLLWAPDWIMLAIAQEYTWCSSMSEASALSLERREAMRATVAAKGPF